jgi:hypothetical protein
VTAIAILSGMTTPQVIPIARIPGYRTEFAGTWSRGQFLGNVLSQTDPVAGADGDRINSRRWYAYLHEFDHEGNYRNRRWRAQASAKMAAKPRSSS